ncbi:hypothetical protein GOOTI_075_00130 [Gordonia otitidis NBRC 100426]|uniref:Uncharacterized protein n=1 Tax=Gordonia otitidis (strain DSM 44809 / CCUG 52243 / JCM 12355 / NBRC 100426 / IFM 10032) TaxID=1108044 RepID=H5TJF6_GORO1|nr:hypothetical protein GOOTI_075_00130 [Gordonia otitidis NBRC 100426]
MPDDSVTVSVDTPFISRRPDDIDESGPGQALPAEHPTAAHAAYRGHIGPPPPPASSPVGPLPDRTGGDLTTLAVATDDQRIRGLRGLGRPIDPIPVWSREDSKKTESRHDLLSQAVLRDT